LYERELCDFIGVSRTTIRESLRQLESESVIKVIPQKGPIVATVTIEEANDIYEVREFLEGLMCRLFAEHATHEAISSLDRSMRLIEVCAHERADDQAAESDKFYEIIMEGCKNRVVLSLLGSLRTRIGFLRAISLSHPDRRLESAKELRQIYEAFEKHDADAAWNASTYHVRAAKMHALQYLNSLNKGDTA
jgi:DNA-binding GntR family transcriptional regulator